MVKVIREGPGWALIKTSWHCVQHASCESDIANSVIVNRLKMDGSENVLFTFAKAFHKGRGTWLVSGYAHDGSDISRAIERMNEAWRDLCTPAEVK